MSQNPTVSIILCTLNRSQHLRPTLASIACCDVPPDLPCELLVVDNGSTDQTREVAESAGLNNMPLRYLREPIRGKSRAYNTAFSHAKGSIFISTDDDVRVPTHWIEGMARPISDGRADAVAGGVIFPPHYAAPMSLPAVQHRLAWFASTGGINPHTPERMVGANMAFGRHVLEAVSGFNLELGPGAMGFCEETLFSYQLLDCGYRIVSAFDAAVEHHFDLSRLNRKSLLALAAGLGRCDGYMEWHWFHRPHAVGPLLRLKNLTGLWRRRLKNLRRWTFGNEIDDWEINRVHLIAFRQQYLIESRKPRKFSRSARQAVAAA